MHRILITRRLPEEGIGKLLDTADVDIWPEDGPMPRESMLERIAPADAIISLLSDRIDEEAMDAAPSLKAIANYAVGYDNIDVGAATSRGIPVLNTPGVLTDATADLAFSLLLSVARRVVESDRYVREGRFRIWEPKLLLGKELKGRTLGVVGAGQIGSAVMRRARCFGMELAYHSRKRRPGLEEELGCEFLPLDELLERSDFITLHVPLTEETRHMIGRSELKMMGPGSVLINTSRGAVVEENALVEALKNGDIWGAGLDVYEEEPRVHSDLIGLDNVVLLPHLGSATEETRTKMAELAVNGLMTVLSGGVPENCVNPEVLEGGVRRIV